MLTLIHHQRISGLKREYAGLFLAVLAFIGFPSLARYIDITAAPIDAGIISAIILAILAFLTFQAVAWWIINSIWPVFAHYSKNTFEQHFNILLPWQKVLIYLAFYLLLVCLLVATLAALI